jgi:hypothetical protein
MNTPSICLKEAKKKPGESLPEAKLKPKGGLPTACRKPNQSLIHFQVLFQRFPAFRPCKIP